MAAAGHGIANFSTAVHHADLTDRTAALEAAIASARTAVLAPGAAETHAWHAYARHQGIPEKRGDTTGE